MKGVGQRAAPRLQKSQRRAAASRIEERRDIATHFIGNQHLFCQPQHEQRHPRRQLVIIGTIGLTLCELRHHLGMMQNRPRDQMREIGHEQTVMDKAVFACLALIGVHQKRDLREGEKRNPQRQNDGAQTDTGSGRCVQVIDKEVRVFVIRQQGEIGNNRKSQQTTRAANNAHAQRIVEDHRRGQQSHVNRVPPAVKE